MSQKYTIDDAKALAIERGGECLSVVYRNCSKDKLRWRCNRDHQWNSCFRNISQGTWCPTCAGKVKLTLEDAQRAALEHNGECLSMMYTGNKTKMQWRCDQGHCWSAIFKNVRRGVWCQKCAGNAKFTLEDAQQAALERDGECLSNSYESVFARMRWRCGHFHEWQSSFQSISRGAWCPVCAGNARLTIEDAQRVAHDRGGECLSEYYDNNHTNLRWRCAKRHEWVACLSNVKNSGTWCPSCPFKSEDGCRRIVERLTGALFSKCKPGWLGGLELDGYNEDLRLAFEYQGEQHYNYIPHFHRNGPEDLVDQRIRDARKRELCDEHWVVLIEIPHWIKNREHYLATQLMGLGVPLVVEDANRGADEVAEVKEIALSAHLDDATELLERFGALVLALDDAEAFERFNPEPVMRPIFNDKELEEFLDTLGI
jgi:hypothetical protein